jgi:hypothetical protein
MNLYKYHAEPSQLVDYKNHLLTHKNPSFSGTTDTHAFFADAITGAEDKNALVNHYMKYIDSKEVNAKYEAISHLIDNVIKNDAVNYRLGKIIVDHADDENQKKFEKLALSLIKNPTKPRVIVKPDVFDKDIIIDTDYDYNIMGVLISYDGNKIPTSIKNTIIKYFELVDIMLANKLEEFGRINKSINIKGNLSLLKQYGFDMVWKNTISYLSQQYQRLNSREEIKRINSLSGKEFETATKQHGDATNAVLQLMSAIS